MWRNRLTLGIRHGVPAGIAFGSIMGIVNRSLVGGVFEALFFGTFMGWWNAQRLLRSVDPDEVLTPAERLAAVTAVRRGTHSTPAARRLAEQTLAAQARDRRLWWVMPGFLIVTVVFAITADGTGARVVWWGLVAFWIVFLATWPRRRARIERRARQALEV